jgi:hypothetical protein
MEAKKIKRRVSIFDKDSSDDGKQVIILKLMYTYIIYAIFFKDKIIELPNDIQKTKRKESIFDKIDFNSLENGNYSSSSQRSFIECKHLIFIYKYFAYHHI